MKYAYLFKFISEIRNHYDNYKVSCIGFDKIGQFTESPTSLKTLIAKNTNELTSKVYTENS
uniref:Uncharacterized protein n=1 Tax=Schistosoma haematobium TaxID=6185 RepID=A0A095AG09_SCHHA